MLINTNKVYKDAECQHLAGYLFYAHYASDNGSWLSYDKDGNDPVMPENLTEEMFMTGVYVADVAGSIMRTSKYMTVENKPLVGKSETYTGPVLFAAAAFLNGDTLSATSNVTAVAYNCAGKYLAD